MAAALDQSAGRLALSMLGSQLRQARAERLASTPRRVGTRFGVLLVVACFALNGADAVPAALAAIEAGAGSLSFAA